MAGQTDRSKAWPSPTCKCFLLFACWSKAWKTHMADRTKVYSYERKIICLNDFKRKKPKLTRKFWVGDTYSWTWLNDSVSRNFTIKICGLFRFEALATGFAEVLNLPRTCDNTLQIYDIHNRIISFKTNIFKDYLTKLNEEERRLLLLLLQNAKHDNGVRRSILSMTEITHHFIQGP